jgi:hypothetical protein
MYVINFQWDPLRLEDVTKDMVDSYFAPLGEFEPDLNLPTSIREPSVWCYSGDTLTKSWSFIYKRQVMLLCDSCM